jgi:hypothetical protein
LREWLKKRLEPQSVFLPSAGGLALPSLPLEMVVVEAECRGGRRLRKRLLEGR